MNAVAEKNLTDILLRHPKDSSELITILQEAQERFGYLSPDVMEAISKYLRVSPSVLYGAATFYTQFKLKPSGKNTVRVCLGTACHVRGAPKVLSEVEKRLGVNPGETTADMEYTLETVACIGACALAPNITINNEVHGQLTVKKIGEIFSGRNTEGTK